jgi:hypothetical protein
MVEFILFKNNVAVRADEIVGFAPKKLTEGRFSVFVVLKHGSTLPVIPDIGTDDLPTAMASLAQIVDSTIKRSEEREGLYYDYPEEDEEAPSEEIADEETSIEEDTDAEEKTESDSFKEAE